MEWDQVAEALRGAGLAHLATASAGGDPHVSAVMPTVEGDVLWIVTTASSAKARNIGVNPRVALMWQPTAEIYLWGEARLVPDRGEIGRLWKSGFFPFDLSTFFGSADNPDVVMVRVVPERATVLAQGPGGLTRQRWRRPAPAET